MESSRLKHIVSIIIPAFNEELILKNNIERIINYLSNKPEYKWEILIINDGSSDNTGKIADELAEKYPIVKVIHHIFNQNLGTAIRTGFRHAKGDYFITLDIDLTYSEEHILRLLNKLKETQADMVLASPYLKGGRVTAVPFSRKILSKYANKFMYWVAMEKHHTFTCMVRAYKAEFIKNLNLKSKTVAINTEIIYKADILRARIIEIPAHLDWSGQTKSGGRISSMKIYRSILLNLMAGFILRPYIFFISIASILTILFLYKFIWLSYKIYKIFCSLPNADCLNDKLSEAYVQAYNQYPHSFIISGFILVVMLQFFSIGFISLQKKRYFEELFHLGTTILKK